MLVAQISDLHIRRKGLLLPHLPHVAGPLRRALTTIHSLAQRPTCIVATGDLTENGTRAEYERLREILSWSQIPVYLLAGNHDRRPALRAVFNDQLYLRTSGAVQFTIESASSRVVALDSSDPPSRGGFLDAERLDWLDETLRARSETTTILALHHPPFQTRVSSFDAQPFVGIERLAALLNQHRQVQRIICGHVHQMLRRVWCGAVAISAPSTAPTLTLHERGSVRWEPGGFLLHHCIPGVGVKTEFVRVNAQPVAVGEEELTA